MPGAQILDTDKLLVQRNGESFQVSFYDFQASMPWFPIWEDIIGLVTEIDGGESPDESIERPRPIDNGIASSIPLPGINGGGASSI
jgi:hypothetical protein